MQKNEFTTQINAPRQIVWQVMTDHERYLKWTKAKKLYYEKTGTPEKQGLGAIRVFKTGFIKSREEVVGWNPPISMTYRLLASFPIRNYISEMEIAEKDGGTTLAWTSTWINRVPRLLGGGLTKKVISKSLLEFAKGIKTESEALAKGGDVG